MDDVKIIISFFCAIIFFIIYYINYYETNIKYNPYRYIWDTDELKKKHDQEKKQRPHKIEKLKQLYNEAIKRIEHVKLNLDDKLNEILNEAEQVLGRKRSFELLKKKTWSYAKKLAQIVGYNEEEVEKKDFFCPGWVQIWDLYQRNRKRILEEKNNPNKTYSNNQKSEKTKSNKPNLHRSFLNQKKIFFEEATREFKRASSRNQLQESCSDYFSFFYEYYSKFNCEFYESYEYHSLKSLFDDLCSELPNEENHYFRNNKKNINKARIKEKNGKIFENIFCIKELKKKYYKLAKLNHPDHGGNHKAMRLLNKYYYEAIQKIERKHDF